MIVGDRPLIITLLTITVREMPQNFMGVHDIQKKYKRASSNSTVAVAINP